MAEFIALGPGLLMAFGCLMVALHYWEASQKSRE